MAELRLTFRVHAIRRMFERGITAADVRQIVAQQDAIESYPDDRPYPSRLILGEVSGRPVHVVVADNVAECETIVITTYHPDPAKWDASFRTRKTP